MYSFVNDFCEDDLQGPKQGRAAPQNNKWLFIVACAISWIKYCIIKLLHGICKTLNGYHTVFLVPGLVYKPL